LCPGNYFDYVDDEFARQRELELYDTWNGPGAFLDVAFPPNARSLYFDPLNPPKGAIPNESIQWRSISDGDIYDCDQAVTFLANETSSVIIQGALGNSYFVNALKFLACYPPYIKRLLVSEKFASKGLYTIKFYKLGRWRYVHIDDRIPCRQSGRVNFCRNGNPNETFAMIIEKAYAKLHGCYEAIAVGLVEKVLHDFTPSAGVESINLNSLSLVTICDTIWDYLESAVNEKRCIGCSRFIADPQGENVSARQGITVGCLYQVMDICIASAEPTEDLDALTIGMVCVRNLQPSGGRFNGRWSYGDSLWSDYNDIGIELYQKTREIQFKRGLGPDPSLDTLGDIMRLRANREKKQTMLGNEVYENDEPDDDDFDYVDKQAEQRMVQPYAEDLSWIQIEDFVEVFNRVYIVTDLTFEKTGAVRRFASKWMPGDYIAGAAGPPIVITTTTEEATENAVDDQDESTIVSLDKDKQQDVKDAMSVKPKEKGVRKVALINEAFTDNPMYPFSVSENTVIAVSLYQQDLRWSVGRLGDDSRQVSVQSFASRGERHQACMRYPIAIGFVVLKLNGLKHRVTDFKLKKVVSKSQGLQFSNINSAAVRLRPGRYAIVPYTHIPLDRAMEYVLHFNYLVNHVEFEVEDVVAQRLMDDAPSDDEDDEVDDNDLLRVNAETEEVSVMTYEKLTESYNEDNYEGDETMTEAEGGDSMKAREVRLIAPPSIILTDPAEYLEDTEELGIVSIFHEVGDIMKYLSKLKGEVRKLHSTIQNVTKSVMDEEKE